MDVELTDNQGNLKYMVALKLRPYGIVPRQELAEIKRWLHKEIGEEWVDWRWVIDIMADIEHGSIDTYSFRRENDKVRFILRWA